MIDLDGSGGGGQLVRTALSLSALSGRAFSMNGIREDRPNPGLRPQHLAAVRAIAQITDAEVAEATEGSRTLRFRPGPILPGRYDVDVGTAGSVTLLFDAVLPLLVSLEGTLVLRASGGTDVRWAPSFDYFRRVKLPLLRRHGLSVAVDLDGRGFYPVGGGSATLSLAASTPEPLELDADAAPATARVYSVATTGLADGAVAERQADAVVDGLDGLAVDVTERTVEYATAPSPGSTVTIRLDRGTSILGVDALGERGKPSEAVAEEAVDRARETVESGAAVDVHLADQLLSILCSTGGHVSIPRVTGHVETSLSLLEQFGHRLRIDRTGDCPVVDA